VLVLLDENLPRDLARAAGHVDAFITMDTNLEFQQRLAGRPFGVVVIHARSNRVADLLPLADLVLAALADIATRHGPARWALKFRRHCIPQFVPAAGRLPRRGRRRSRRPQGPSPDNRFGVMQSRCRDHFEPPPFDSLPSTSPRRGDRPALPLDSRGHGFARSGRRE